MNTYDEDLICKGVITARQGFEGPMNRSYIITDTLAAYLLPPEVWRVHDAYTTVLPGTAASDDLAAVTGAYGTGCPYISAGDQNGVASSTRYARTLFQLPPEYSSGNLIRLNASGGLLSGSTSTSGTSTTVDFECYLCNRDGQKTGSDLVTTAAQSIYSATFAEKSFVVTPTGLIPGKILDIRVAIIAVHNHASSSTPILGAVEVLLDVKG